MGGIIMSYSNNNDFNFLMKNQFELLLNQYIDATLSPEGERELFLLAAENDTWRSELASALKVHSVLKEQTERFDVPASLTANVFGALGYSSTIITADSVANASAVATANSVISSRLVLLWDSIASVFRNSLPLILSFVAGIILMWGVNSYVENSNTQNQVKELNQTSLHSEVKSDTRNSVQESGKNNPILESSSANHLRNQQSNKGTTDFAREELQDSHLSTPNTTIYATKTVKSVRNRSVNSGKLRANNVLHTALNATPEINETSITSSTSVLGNSNEYQPNDDKKVDNLAAKRDNDANSKSSISSLQHQLSIPLISTVFAKPIKEDDTLQSQSESKTEDPKKADDETKKYKVVLRMMYPRSVASTAFKPDDNIGLSNLMVGAYYQFRSNFFAGIEVGREAYYQKFTRTSGLLSEQITQYPTMWLGGIALRYELRSLISEKIYPTFGAGIGMAETGYYTRLNGGLAWDFSTDVSFTLGGEWSNLYYPSTGSNFNSPNLGFMYGISVRW